MQFLYHIFTFFVSPIFVYQTHLNFNFLKNISAFTLLSSIFSANLKILLEQWIDSYLILICQAIHVKNMFAEKCYNLTRLTRI